MRKGSRVGRSYPQVDCGPTVAVASLAWLGTGGTVGVQEGQRQLCCVGTGDARPSAVVGSFPWASPAARCGSWQGRAQPRHAQAPVRTQRAPSVPNTMTVLMGFAEPELLW